MNWRKYVPAVVIILVVLVIIVVWVEHFSVAVK